jgi:transposase InsO family protein
MGIILMKTKPVLIQSDNGTEFISKEFQHVLDKHDVRHVTVIAGNHNRQSIVERFN